MCSSSCLCLGSWMACKFKRQRERSDGWLPGYDTSKVEERGRQSRSIRHGGNVALVTVEGWGYCSGGVSVGGGSVLCSVIAWYYEVVGRRPAGNEPRRSGTHRHVRLTSDAASSQLNSIESLAVYGQLVIGLVRLDTE